MSQQLSCFIAGVTPGQCGHDCPPLSALLLCFRAEDSKQNEIAPGIQGCRKANIRQAANEHADNREARAEQCPTAPLGL